MDRQEKLLAARKRLKEFQKKKQEHSQENHSSQRNDSATEANETAEHISVKNEHTKNLPESQASYQSNLNQNNNEHSITVTDSCTNVSLHFENNQPNSAVESVFSMTECQNNQSDDNFTSSHHNEHSETIQNERKHENDNPAAEWVGNSTHIHPEVQYLKDCFINQKEHMLRMSSAIEDVLKDNSNSVNDEDGYHYLNPNPNAIEDNKKMVDALQKQLLQYENKIQELENALVAKDTEYQDKLSREVKPLQEQLQIHAHTTSILVAEKAELSATISQNQATIQQKIDEVKDLSNKLKASHLRITELEKELIFIRSNNNDVQKTCQQLQKRFDDLSNQFSELGKSKEDLELETSELRQKLNVKHAELSNVQQELQEKIALLSLSELKIQQLSNSPQETQMMDNHLYNTFAAYEQQIAQLKETIKNLTDEKSDTGKQYKSYVQQLDERNTQLANELELAKKQIASFESREESYIQRLSDMEQQLQKEKEKSESLPPVEDQQARIDVLTKNVDQLVCEQESLQTALNNKALEIEELKSKLEEQQESKEQEVDVSKLVTALEREQLDASRAISENQKLAHNLSLLQIEYEKMKNNKEEVTEKLLAERYVGKKLNAMLNDVEKELAEVKEQLVEKEAALLEYEKEKLRAAQIEDHVQHYQAQLNHASTLQQELSKALGLVEILKKENERLNDKINAQSRTITDLEQSLEKNEINSEHTSEIMNVEITRDNDNNDIRIRKISTETQTSTPESEGMSFNIPEPLKKLEVKFKQTMEQVADLTDEKQRLEHLVMQLQGETETIGEYIALYQKQRLMLHERAKEKEKAFKILIDQRNQLQEQLHKLKILVSNLFQNKINYSSNTDHDSIVNNNENNEVKSEEQPTNIIEPTPVIDLNDKTTAEILDLLTEIKDCNSACLSEPDFHPCPWCSGKLITV